MAVDQEGGIGASAAKVPRARKGHATACTEYIGPRFGPYGEKIAYIAGEYCMRSTDEDVIAERRHEELTQMKLERIVRKATPARSQSKVMKAFCDPDLHYLVTPDNPADLEDESEEEHYDEDLVKEHGIVDSGASISVTNPETAKHFGLDVRPWNKPKKITISTLMMSSHMSPSLKMPQIHCSVSPT